MRILVFTCVASLLASGASASAQVQLTSSAVLERAALPGERYEGRIELSNSSNVPREARLYLSDYAATADGTVSYGAPGTSPRSNAAWISLGSSRVVIPAGSRATVTYVVTVPAQPSLAGTYWSMVMVEGVDASATARSQPAGLGVRTVLRYGIQVATHLGDSSAAGVGFDNVRAATGPDGERSVTFDFANVGARASRLLMSVELFGADGRPVRRLEQQRGLLFPGNSARQTFRFGTLPSGTYTAIITADAGGDELFGAQYTLRY